MTTPHRKPAKISQTKMLRATQSLGGEDKKPEPHDWFQDEGFEISRRALIEMQKNGWRGYAYETKKKRRHRAHRTP